MLKIRYQRTGRKNDPSYRIVVTEHTRGPNAGNNIATVGSYHPKTKETIIDAEAVKMWISRGAQTSDTVHNLLVSKGVIEGEKKNVLPKKTPIIKKDEEEKGDGKEGETANSSDEGAQGAEDSSTEESVKEDTKEEGSVPGDDESSAEDEEKEEEK